MLATQTGGASDSVCAERSSVPQPYPSKVILTLEDALLHQLFGLGSRLQSVLELVLEVSVNVGVMERI